MTAYTVITSLGTETSSNDGTLQGIQGNLSGDYVLGSNIDASATSGWNSGAGFTPIGNGSATFTGIFDGLGHTVDGLTMNLSGSAAYYVGMFGYNQGVICNVGLTEVNVSGNVAYGQVGSLVGANGTYNGSGSITNCYSTGTVTGDGTNMAVGGLVGYNDGRSTASIDNSYSSVNVTGNAGYIGGLVGDNNGDFGTASISNCYSTGSVTGTGTYIGGLVGYNIGQYGSSYGTASITNCYSTGSVTATGTSVGGLVGYNSDNYSPSSSTGTASITNSYWDTTTSGQTNGVGTDVTNNAVVTGLTDNAMKQASSYSGWNVATDGGSDAMWRIYEGNTYPLLTAFLTPITVTANDATVTYSGTSYSGGAGATYSISSATLDGTLNYGGTSQGAVNSGTYTIIPSDLYSDQQGYDISYASGTLTINMPPANNTQPTDYSNYVPKVNSTPATSDNNPSIQIVQGGISTPLVAISAAVPATLQAQSGTSLTTISGGTKAITVDMSGSTLTINFVGGTGTSSVTPVMNSDVALVSVGTSGVQAKDYYQVASSSDSITMITGNATTSALPTEPLASSPSTTFSINTTDGNVAQFQVQYAGSAICIKPLNDAATTMANDSGNNKKLVAASGLVAAQKDLSVDDQSIEAIYLH